MKDWEILLEAQLRADEDRTRKFKEELRENAVNRTVDYFEKRVIQEAETAFTQFSEALKKIPTGASSTPGDKDILPDEKAILVRLVKGVTRQLQWKYCLVDPVEPTPAVLERDVETIVIADDSNPPSPIASRSAFESGHPFGIRGEPSPDHGNNGQKERSMTEGTILDRGPMNITEPTANVPEEPKQLSRDKRPHDIVEPGVPEPSSSRQTKRARPNADKAAAEFVENEPTVPASIRLDTAPSTPASARTRGKTKGKEVVKSTNNTTAIASGMAYAGPSNITVQSSPFTRRKRTAPELGPARRPSSARTSTLQPSSSVVAGSALVTDMQGDAATEARDTTQAAASTTTGNVGNETVVDPSVWDFNPSPEDEDVDEDESRIINDLIHDLRP